MAPSHLPSSALLDLGDIELKKVIHPLQEFLPDGMVSMGAVKKSCYSPRLSHDGVTRWCEEGLPKDWNDVEKAGMIVGMRS